MNTRETLPSHSSGEQARIVIEEMACVIAEAQAALFAGRYTDLEICAVRLESLCASLKSVEVGHRHGSPSTAPALILAVRKAHTQNKIFAAALRRMRRHLDTMRAVLTGPSFAYKPKILALPERDR